MPDVSFTNLLIVAAVAVLAPLTVGFFPRLRVPAIVLEIIGGIIIGPSVLGWAHVDLPVSILALFGLGLLLFLAGLGRGRVLHGGRVGVAAAADRHHPLVHRARRGRPGAQGRRAAAQPGGAD